MNSELGEEEIRYYDTVEDENWSNFSIPFNFKRDIFGVSLGLFPPDPYRRVSKTEVLCGFEMIDEGLHFHTLPRIVEVGHLSSYDQHGCVLQNQLMSINSR